MKDTILHGESEGKTFYEIIQAGKAFGMMTFDDSIVELFRRGLISEKTGKAYASNRGIVGRGIDAVKSSKGQATTDLGRLEVDRDYGKPANRQENSDDKERGRSWRIRPL